MSRRVFTKATPIVPVDIQHVCDRCKAKSPKVNFAFAEFLPSGWSFLRYVDPEPLADDVEMNFCPTCSSEIMERTR